MSAEFWATMWMAAVLFGLLFGRVTRKQRSTNATVDDDGTVWYN